MIYDREYSLAVNGNLPECIFRKSRDNSLMDITRESQVSIIEEEISRQGLSVLGLEKLAGLKQDTLRDFFRGKTHILRADKWQKVQIALGLTTSEKIPVLGEIGPLGSVTFLSDFHLSLLTDYMSEKKTRPYRASGGKMNTQPEMVDAPPGIPPSKVIAFRVKDDANYPVYQKGYVVYPEITLDTNPSSYINDRCLLKLASGEYLIATIVNGRKYGTYTLNRFNAPPLVDVNVVWALPIYATIERPR